MDIKRCLNCHNVWTHAQARIYQNYYLLPRKLQQLALQLSAQTPLSLEDIVDALYVRMREDPDVVIADYHRRWHLEELPGQGDGTKEF